MAPILAGWGPVLRVLEIVPGSGASSTSRWTAISSPKKMLGSYPQPEDVLPLLRGVMGDEVL